MGLTYYSRGRNLIVNAGHTGYEVSPYRDYIRSLEAASMLISPGARFDAAAATSLTASEIGTGSQFYEFSDDAFGGPRSRSVYVHQGPAFVLVLDRGSGEESYQQLWHLAPGLTVTSVTAASATATAPAVVGTATSPAIPATTLRIARIALPGQVIPAGSTTVVKGQTNPYQGWVSHQALQRITAPVVIMNSKDTGTDLSTAVLTLIAATAPGTPIRATAAATATPGRYNVRVCIGTDTVTVPMTIP
jgi:hypothetical protein